MLIYSSKKLVFLGAALATMVLPLQAEEFEFVPSAKFSAEEVVLIQLAALEKNDYPEKDAGIAVAYRFASPSNKLITGPLEQFTAMVSAGSYRFLLDHASARIGPPDQDAWSARIPVVVTTLDGQEKAYIFFLSKQDDQSCGCWLTDSVIPIQPHETPRTPVI